MIISPTANTTTRGATHRLRARWSNSSAEPRPRTISDDAERMRRGLAHYHHSVYIKNCMHLLCGGGQKRYTQHNSKTQPNRNNATQQTMNPNLRRRYFRHIYTCMVHGSFRWASLVYRRCVYPHKEVRVFGSPRVRCAVGFGVVLVAGCGLCLFLVLFSL